MNKERIADAILPVKAAKQPYNAVKKIIPPFQ